MLAAVGLFSLDWFTADTIAPGLLVTLVLTALRPVERAFDGFGPGRSRFADFLKVGELLTVIVSAPAILLVPRFWPLR